MEVNRRISFRGRVNMGYAHWKYKGVRNVIILYLNKITDETIILHHRPTHTKMFEQLFIFYFTLVDFHEWLHIFIRRKSGEKDTYFVTDEVHDWMRLVEHTIMDIWWTELVESERLKELEPCNIPLNNILERDCFN